MRLRGWLGTDSCFSETADVLVPKKKEAFMLHKRQLDTMRERWWIENMEDDKNLSKL